MSSGACAPRSASAARDRATSGRPSAGPRRRARPAATARPPERQAVIAASCRRRNSSGAKFAARSCGSGMSTSGASKGRVFGRVEADQRSVFSRSARRCSAGASAAEALPAPFGDRMQRRILQELRGAPFDPGVRRLARAARGTPRSAATCRGRARRRSARAGPRLRARAPSGASAGRAPPRGRRTALERAPRASAAAARANDAVKRDRLRHALELVAPCSSATKSPATCRCTRAVTRTGPARPAPAPAPRRSARRRTPRRSRRPRPGRTRWPMRADKLRRALAGVSGVEVGKRALDGERGPHRALGVVLLRLRIAEQRHQPVAELLQHMAAETGHRRRSLVEIGVDEVAPVLGVELRGEARRADEIAEHHRDRRRSPAASATGAPVAAPVGNAPDANVAAGAGTVGGADDSSVKGSFLPAGFQLADCSQQLEPMSERGNTNSFRC